MPMDPRFYPSRPPLPPSSSSSSSSSQSQRPGSSSAAAAPVASPSSPSSSFYHSSQQQQQPSYHHYQQQQPEQQQQQQQQQHHYHSHQYQTQPSRSLHPPLPPPPPPPSHVTQYGQHNPSYPHLHHAYASTSYQDAPSSSSASSSSLPPPPPPYPYTSGVPAYPSWAATTESQYSGSTPYHGSSSAYSHSSRFYPSSSSTPPSAGPSRSPHAPHSSHHGDPSHGVHSRGPMTYSPAAGRSTPEGLGKRKGAPGGGPMARDASQPYLKKQQACLTCKRRKTRCDAVRPICGACGRSQKRAARGHALTADVPPGDCVYPEEDSPSSPAASASESMADAAFTTPILARHPTTIESTSARIGEAEASMPFASRPSSRGNRNPSMIATGPSPGVISSDSSPRTVNTVTTAPTSYTDLHRGRHGELRNERIVLELQSSHGQRARVRRVYQTSVRDGENPQMSLRNLMDPIYSENPTAANASFSGPSKSTSKRDGDEEEDKPKIDLMLRQLLPELTPDLPTPETIHHMAKLFFDKHPLRNMFCKKFMLARFRLPPGHPLRPHPSLIHAVLAVAEPYSPLLGPVRDHNPLWRQASDEDETAADNPGKNAMPSMYEKMAYDFEASGRGLLGIVHPLEASRPELSVGPGSSFGEFHLAKARREIEVALLTSNSRPREWIQATALVLYGISERCRAGEYFLLAACAARGMSATAYGRMPNDRDHIGYTRGIIGPPENSIADYEQRMAFWQVYIADTYGGGGVRHYEPTFCDEKNQLTTTMPVQMEEVEEDTDLVYSQQTFNSPDLFRAGHTDSFSLLVKSASLLKRARMIASRNGTELSLMSRPPPQVLELDSDVKDFLTTFPKRRGIDSDWIVAGESLRGGHRRHDCRSTVD
ncbi:hypothetical protein BCV69DRAFT_163006 [Microstroma glucosiphilum]|uniref:Zn(2)-C6 fungal-type domain-containing protein n=1 Tax=Pseudomicrostroma glucosiphilum TaxID=1684307 RepID=A0A316UA46_9BASI|nr:hypothetical protein BCV69DRAFT_163006 [Pseudomicrostroma glucosiphilum]PWN22042.1 hypothetical protein BCV69DRAFT_163006 [Pseudomicrostroma glucosiphilum]